MGAQWKHKGRVESAAKRGQIISKMVKEIIMATKAGEPDPESNARLRVAIEDAKKASVPRDNIERAIKKGAGLLEPVNYELVTYEGYAPHKVPLIVECLTDNRNRTAPEIRNLFNKGSLGVSGSVSFLFTRYGMVVATHPDVRQDPEEAAIEAGAQEVEKIEDGIQFLCEINDLAQVSKRLASMGWQISASEFSYICKAPVEINEAQRKEVNEFLGGLDDNDDVHRIYAGIK